MRNRSVDDASCRRIPRQEDQSHSASQMESEKAVRHNQEKCAGVMERLRTSGIRPTIARIGVLQVIGAVAPGRICAEDVFRQMLLRGTRVSIGTVYRAELCFLRGLDPRDPVETVADLRAVVVLARRLLVANADRAVRVTTGVTRRGRRLWVYGRDGMPCRRCGARVETFRLGGLADPDEPSDSLDRIAYRCPSCQPRRATLARPSSEENT